MEAAAAKGAERKRDAAARADEAKERRKAAVERFMANRAALFTAVKQRGEAEAERCATAEAKRTRSLSAYVEKVQSKSSFACFDAQAPLYLLRPHPTLHASYRAWSLASSRPSPPLPRPASPACAGVLAQSAREFKHAIDVSVAQKENRTNQAMEAKVRLAERLDAASSRRASHQQARGSKSPSPVRVHRVLNDAQDANGL